MGVPRCNIYPSPARPLDTYCNGVKASADGAILDLEGDVTDAAPLSAALPSGVPDGVCLDVRRNHVTAVAMRGRAEVRGPAEERSR